MPTEPPRASRNPPLVENSGRRLHIHGIREMPAGYDAEVGELFRDLRAASSLSEADLARTIQTRPEVVQALEQGAIYALPPWPETLRVVNAYGTLLNLDVRPLLRRIYGQFEAGIVGLQPKSVPELPIMPGPQPADYPFEPPQRPKAQTQQPVSKPGQPGPYSQPDFRPAPQRPNGPPDVPLDLKAPARFPPGQGQPPQQRSAQGGNQPQPSHRPQGSQAPVAKAPQAKSQPQPSPQSWPMQGSQPQPQPKQTSEPAAALPPEPKAPKPRRAILVKVGVAALVLAGIMLGIWSLMSKPALLGPSTPSQGGKGATTTACQPSDPCSHKADRLNTPKSPF